MVGFDVQGFINWVKSLGPFGMVVLILVGFYLRWWYFGWQYEDLKRDRDEWKLLAQTGTAMAERATSTATEVTKRRAPR